MRNYNSFSPVEPVWTQTVSDPEDGLVCTTRECFEGISKTTAAKCAQERVKEKKGLTVLQTTIFIAGEMAGSGVLALPRAIVTSGWIGLVLLIIFCANAAYGGTRLGECWQILEERFPEYRNKTRNPYAIIAQKAVGSWTSKFVSGCIQFTLFGAGTVYLLLASQILQELLSNLFTNTSLCSWFVLIALLLTPLMWLGSPKDFPFVGVIAISTTFLSCVLYFTQIVMDGFALTEPVKHDVHNFHDFFLAFGTLLFAFGGASTFPTIQNDMEKKNKFSVSVTISFTVVLLLYLPIAVGGFFVYGENVLPNVAISISETGLVTLANILMAIHLIFAFLIIINPVCQELEEIFGLPHDFSWRRCLVRSTMLLFIIMVGETIPKFGKILSLVGGSTITLLTFVFPSYFYMKLCSQKSPLWPERRIPGYVKLYMWELILMGLLGGTASTFNAIEAIFGSDSFTRPCYWH